MKDILLSCYKIIKSENPEKEQAMFTIYVLVDKITMERLKEQARNPKHVPYLDGIIDLLPYEDDMWIEAKKLE